MYPVISSSPVNKFQDQAAAENPSFPNSLSLLEDEYSLGLSQSSQQSATSSSRGRGTQGRRGSSSSAPTPSTSTAASRRSTTTASAANKSSSSLVPFSAATPSSSSPRVSPARQARTSAPPLMSPSTPRSSEHSSHVGTSVSTSATFSAFDSERLEQLQVSFQQLQVQMFKQNELIQQEIQACRQSQDTTELMLRALCQSIGGRGRSIHPPVDLTHVGDDQDESSFGDRAARGASTLLQVLAKKAAQAEAADPILVSIVGSFRLIEQDKVNEIFFWDELLINIVIDQKKMRDALYTFAINCSPFVEELEFSTLVSKIHEIISSSPGMIDATLYYLKGIWKKRTEVFINTKTKDGQTRPPERISIHSILRQAMRRHRGKISGLGKNVAKVTILSKVGSPGDEKRLVPNAGPRNPQGSGPFFIHIYHILTLSMKQVPCTELFFIHSECLCQILTLWKPQLT